MGFSSVGSQPGGQGPSLHHARKSAPPEVTRARLFHEGLCGNLIKDRLMLLGGGSMMNLGLFSGSHATSANENKRRMSDTLTCRLVCIRNARDTRR